MAYCEKHKCTHADDIECPACEGDRALRAELDNIDEEISELQESYILIPVEKDEAAYANLLGPFKCPTCGGYIVIDGDYVEQVDTEMCCPYCTSLIYFGRTDFEPETTLAVDQPA